MDVKVIITCFAGRKDYLEVQIKYIIELLNRYSFIERYDIWNYSWSEDDFNYVNSLSGLHPRINICHSPDYGKPSRGNDVASKQFAYFFSEAYPKDQYHDYVFLKIDDDVVYVDIDRFEEFIKFRVDNDKYFLVSADVVNNQLSNTNPESIHDEFLSVHDKKLDLKNEIFSDNKRLSINFVSWLGSHLPEIINEFSNGVGRNDEWRLCNNVAKKMGMRNLILKNYSVVHFSFGTQTFNKEKYIKKYNELCSTII
jgi:hypothetical protein